MNTVLDILKQSDTGVTQAELDTRANRARIQNPFVELGSLIAQGYARFDENPRPGRFKATVKAWTEAQST